MDMKDLSKWQTAIQILKTLGVTVSQGHGTGQKDNSFALVCPTWAKRIYGFLYYMRWQGLGKESIKLREQLSFTLMLKHAQATASNKC